FYRADRYRNSSATGRSLPRRRSPTARFSRRASIFGLAQRPIASARAFFREKAAAWRRCCRSSNPTRLTLSATGRCSNADAFTSFRSSKALLCQRTSPAPRTRRARPDGSTFSRGSSPTARSASTLSRAAIRAPSSPHFRRHDQEAPLKTSFALSDEALAVVHAQAALVDGSLNLRDGVVLRIDLSEPLAA